MKLEDARSAYETLSGRTSDIVRQMSLAAVALIWIFKSGTTTSLSLDPQLLRAAFCVFLALLFDFLQYLLGTTIWFAYFRYKEKRGSKENAEFLAPTQLNWPTWTFFYLKSALILVAYCRYILPYIASRFGVLPSVGSYWTF
jgi:hypothetical protein